MFFFIIALLQVSTTLPMSNKTFVDAETVKKMSCALHKKIVDDQFKPHAIIGIARGGLAPTSYLAGQACFNNRNVTTISVKSYEGDQQGDISFTFPVDCKQLEKYNNILIVDDLVDTGKTVEFVKNHFKNELPNNSIKIAALYYKPKKSVIKPDYYVEETSDWIVFPWE